MMVRERKRPYMLYPEDNLKINWDLFITLILLVSCILTPLRIAFGEEDEPIGWVIANYTMDFLFLIDIIVIFNSVYYDEDFNVIDDRAILAK